MKTKLKVDGVCSAVSAFASSKKYLKRDEAKMDVVFSAFKDALQKEIDAKLMRIPDGVTYVKIDYSTFIALHVKSQKIQFMCPLTIHDLTDLQIDPDVKDDEFDASLPF